MSSASERSTNEQTRTYDRASSVVFLKTAAPFGGLSNMAGGFPLHVQGTRIHTSEALYQACRFPHLPAVQRLIIEQASPMTAKMKSKPHRKDSRPDWDRVRVKVMRWCLRVKLAQNWAKFSDLLLQTEDRAIVEESRKDDFWGAKPVDDRTLVGMNVLGRLLMELREAVKSHGRDAFLTVEPPNIPEFLFLSRPIMGIGERELPTADQGAALAAVPGGRRPVQEGVEQASLFDTSSAREAPSPVYVTQRAPKDMLLGDLKPYPAMKDSGVSWLGCVPAHWQVSPAFAVYSPRQVKNTGLVESTVLSLSYGRIIAKASEKLRGLVPESFETYQIVEPGNIIVRTTDLQNDQTSLRIGHARNRGIITAAYMCLEPKPIVLNEFGYQYLNAYDLLKIIYGYGSGLRQNLDFSDIKRMPVLVPPREEQAAIVRFLDHADRRIRRYIRAKQKLIKLLEEQKQAIIHRAVTRGLDPNVRLKPSGVEWLGDVPEHWEVKPLKHFVPQVTVGIVVQPASLYVPEGVPCLRSLNISSGRVEHGPMVYISPESNAKHRKSMLRDGDVVVVRTGRAGVAVVVPADLDGANCMDLLVVRRSPVVESHYLATYLNSWVAKTDVQFRSVGAIQAHYNTATLANMIVAIPPREEQNRLLQHLGSELFTADTSQQRVEREIEFLREYRTRLIADVVTGKLDVREAAARLPQEAEGLEPFDEDTPEAVADEVDTSDTDERPEQSEA